MRVGLRTALAAVALTAAQAENVNVKIMSFNIRTSYAEQDRAATCSNWYGVRQQNVVAQFTSQNADFVGTQETSEEQKGFLDGALAATYKPIGQTSTSLNGNAAEVNAIYYKFADWAKLDERTFWLGPNTDAPSSDWGMKYYRTAVYGRFQHIKTGTTICIFNSHYETPGNDLAQVEASKIINAKRAQFCQPGDKLQILTGDLNAPPAYQAMGTLRDDGWKEESTAPTFCGDMVAPTCGEKFDYTYYRLNAADGCHVESVVHRDPFESGCYASDHAALSGTWCLGTTCCDATETPTEAPAVNPDALASASASAAEEAEIQPGVVVPQGDDSQPLLSGGGQTAGEAGGSAVGAGEPATETSTKSATTTNATGTVFVIMGVLAAVGGVCAFVIKKKRALEAKLDGEKSVFAPARAFFNREEHNALSPVRRATRAIARKFSSPVPTLEMNVDDRQRSFSETSSIVAPRRSSMPLSIEEDDHFNERQSSPVILGFNNGRGTDRGSSRVYFSEVVTDRNARSDFAML